MLEGNEGIRMGMYRGCKDGMYRGVWYEGDSDIIEGYEGGYV